MPQRTDYAPIEFHAAIGDGRTVALIDDTGRVDWLPLPSLASLPVFAALLDSAEGGYLDLAPSDDYSMTRRYATGTNVLETTYTTATGRVKVTDALVTGMAGRLPWAELDRLVEGVEGRVPMSWKLAPGTALRTRSPWIDRVDAGYVIRVGDLSIGLTTTGAARLTSAGVGSVAGSFVATKGSVDAVCVTSTQNEPLHLAQPEHAAHNIERTVAAWRAWCRQFEYVGPWKTEVLRSALALKLLLSSASGAVAAAATTSLPESDTGGKNWDYRFAWIRDLTYTTGALARFGLREETHAALSWLLTTIKEHGPELHVFYGLDGGVDADVVEYTAPGWREIGPVTTGNQAEGQTQLGVYGDLFGLVRAYVDEGNTIDDDTRRFLSTVADRVCDAWRSPDSGMWELEDIRHYTSSKMACWQALDAAIWLAKRGEVADNSARWIAESERIKHWVAEHCWSDEKNAYLMYAGGDALDTSVLLHAASGFDRGPRMSATIDAIRAELDVDGKLYRYSGVAEEEHPFVACTFWTAAALACIGRIPDAEALMTRALSWANPLGLFAEMITENGEFRGNFPQGLSHLALIDAAVTIRDLSD